MNFFQGLVEADMRSMNMKRMERRVRRERNK